MVGDPFEPEMAAAAAGVSELTALAALDELTRSALVRQTATLAGSGSGTRSCAEPSTRRLQPDGGCAPTS